MRKRLGLGLAARAVGASLLHVTEPLAMPLTAGSPMVVTGYDLIPLILHKDYLKKYPWSRAARRWKEARRYGVCRRVIAISHATRADLIEYLDLDENVVDVAHLGVDHQRFTPGPVSDDQRELVCKRYELTKPFLLYVGAFDPRKNVSILIRSFADSGLAKEFDLVLAGANRPKETVPLQALAQQLGVEKEVHFSGFVRDEDLAPLYRICHAHVFPSCYEGFGLTIAEAMACGAPTITVNATSLPEVAGDAALLVPPNDGDALTEAMRALCRDDTRRAELSTLGPVQASRFRWSECARQTLASYRKALA